MSRRTLALPGIPPFPESLQEELWSAFEHQPSSTPARTHHLSEDGRPRYINRLIAVSSPYLLQHAFNPVNWHPWGTEAFEVARREDRPLLLSVGYSTCHWCHVMERESFEDEEIASVLNEHFVPVKVDREERPDIDAVYMNAVQLMSGGGGWPMTVILTPDGEPFFAGTYFPARQGDRGARLGFLDLLYRLSRAWVSDRGKLLAQAAQLTEALVAAARPNPPQTMPGPEALVEACRFLGRIFDPVWGGFGGPPKFPRPSTYELLLRYWLRSADPAALHMVSFSLEKIVAGGVYDHVGGGFARYSTDRRWLIPHFEKMLYDNAQLAVLLSEAFQITQSPTFLQALRETLEYVIGEMTDPKGGGFYSATDADSEGSEGTFFLWTPSQIDAELGYERGQRFRQVYGVTEEGNFEGSNVLHRSGDRNSVSREMGLSPEALETELAADRRRLWEARRKRIPPLLDDKILTEWNAQMIQALARAGFVLDETRYLAAAERAAGFLLDKLRDSDGRLIRAWRGGRSSGRAVLEDYAFSAAALLELFEATGEPKWLSETLDIVKIMIDDYGDPNRSGFFATSRRDPALLVRDRPSYDGAQPSGNSVAALVLLKLAALTENPIYLAWADQTLLAFGAMLEQGAIQTPKLAQALDWRLDGPLQILVFDADDGRGASLTAVLRSRFLPNTVRVLAGPDSLPSLSKVVPWASDKVPLDGRSTAFICTEGVCKLPVTDAEAFERLLSPTTRIDAPAIKLKEPRV